MQAPQPGQVMVLSKCLLFAVLICLEASAHEKLRLDLKCFVGCLSSLFWLVAGLREPLM